MTTFNASKAIGEFAEENVVKYYEECGSTVADVRDDKYFRFMDVDFVVDGATFVEVKADSYDTGNMFIETVSNMTKGTPGCLLITAADLVFYYFIKKGQALLIPAKALKAWIKENISTYMATTQETHNSVGRKLYSSKGCPVPVEVIVRDIPGVQIVTGLPVVTKVV